LKVKGEGVYWIQVALVGTMLDLCEHSKEASDSIKGREFFDWLSDY